jgi:hypothetical protein
MNPRREPQRRELPGCNGGRCGEAIGNWRLEIGNRKSRRRPGQRTQGFGRDGDMARAARFHAFKMLDRGIQKLPVAFGHGVIVTAGG